MVLLDSAPFGVAQYITHPIALIAYACALVAYYFVSKNTNDRKKLEANPDAYIKTAERLHIDFGAIPEGERANITLQVLKSRTTTLLITTASLVVAGLILAYTVIEYQHSVVDGTNNLVANSLAERQAKRDSLEAARKEKLKMDSISRVGQQQRSRDAAYAKEVDLMLTRGSSLLKRIKEGDKKAWNIDYYNFSSQAMGLVKRVESKREGIHPFGQMLRGGPPADDVRMSVKNPKDQNYIDSTSSLDNTIFYIDILEKMKTTL